MAETRVTKRRPLASGATSSLIFSHPIVSTGAPPTSRIFFISPSTSGQLSGGENDATTLPEILPSGVAAVDARRLRGFGDAGSRFAFVAAGSSSILTCARFFASREALGTGPRSSPRKRARRSSAS